MRIAIFRTIPLAALMAGGASADQLVQSVDGMCPESQPVSFQVTVDFTATGGDFSMGTGTATVAFTLENTSGVFPFQSPAVGNPVLTGFFFNLPPGAGAALTDARILAGSALVSTGTVMGGIHLPPGCTVIGADIFSSWYELQGSSATGQFGIFTNGFSTIDGIKAGLVDPDVYVACVAQGNVFSPLVVAGEVRFTVSLTDLDMSLDSAQDFGNLCTLRFELPDASFMAGKFQGTGGDGEESCFIGEPCVPVATQATPWGRMKVLYR